MSKKMVVVRISNHQCLVDTPGLDDTDEGIRNLAAAEITKALNIDGKIRIIFVITLQAGRVQPSDIATMTVVASALPKNFPVGILINKIPNSTLKQLNENMENWTKVVVSCNIGQIHTSFISLLKLYDEMEDRENVILPIEHHFPELQKFIQSVPCEALPRKIPQIYMLDFVKKKQDLETQIAYVNSSNDAMGDIAQHLIMDLEGSGVPIMRDFAMKFKNCLKNLFPSTHYSSSLVSPRPPSSTSLVSPRPPPIDRKSKNNFRK